MENKEVAHPEAVCTASRTYVGVIDRLKGSTNKKPQHLTYNNLSLMTGGQDYRNADPLAQAAAKHAAVAWLASRKKPAFFDVVYKIVGIRDAERHFTASCDIKVPIL